jgi:hypothetical protein
MSARALMPGELVDISRYPPNAPSCRAVADDGGERRSGTGSNAARRMSLGYSLFEALKSEREVYTKQPFGVRVGGARK